MSCTDVETIKPGDGSKTQFSFDFPYIFKSEIHVYFWNATTKEWDEKLTTDATYPWQITDANPTIVEFTSTAPPAPADPVDPGEPTVDNVRIRRITNLDNIRALFNPGSAIRSDDLNNNFEQLRYAIQESNCQGIPDDVDTYLKNYYWNKFDDTIYAADDWPTENKDELIASIAAMDARYLDQTTDTISEAEQDAGSPAPSDANVFSALAAARRFDTLVQTGKPSGSDWETGKTWYQNDEDKTVYVYDPNADDPWVAITSGGAFTRLDQVIYVDATNGDDDNNGHRISTPKKTIKSALAAINSDSTFGNGSTILLAPGIYKETAPLDIEKTDVSIIGASVRNVIVHPTEATETNSLFRVNSGSYLANMTFTGMKASGTRGDTGSLWTDTEFGLPPTQGWNVSFFPNAKIFKSPYIQNCTNFSDSEIDNDALDFYTGDSDRGQAGDLDSAPTGGGLLVNGDTVHDDSPLRSMVADSYTHVGLDGPGIFVTNNGYAQVTSSYAFFNHFHIGCLNGGQANLAASTTDFGRFSLVASGRSPSAIFTATVNGAAADGSTTFDIDNVTAAADWFGNSERPADNMLVDVGGNTYPILSATAIADGWRVEISRPNTNDRTENLGLNGAVADNAAVSFFLRSMIASSGHTMEYVGAGTDYRALPYNATGTYPVGSGTQPNGVPIESHQVKELNNGKVWAAITDHNGTFKVGDTFKVNQQTGFVDIPVGALSVGKLLSDLDVNDNTIQNNSGDTVNINDNLRVQNGNTLLLGDDDDSHAIGLTAPATVTADLTYTLPGTDGNAGEVLSTDGSGTLSWSSSDAVVDQIIEGNTKVEASDSGSNGTVTVTTDGSVAMTFSNSQQVDVTSAGAEATPSLVLASDTNTGIYHPAADTLGVSTNGVERVRVGTTETVINEGGNDHDFRVEGDTVTDLFQVDASADAVNINGDTTVSATATLTINTNSVERAEFGTTEVVFNDGGGDYDFRVEGDTEANLLFVDAGTDRIGIGDGAPGTAVEIHNTAPDITIRNTTEEDIDGGRESRVIFEGEQSGGEISTLARIEASHDGTADDEAGQLILSTNDGSDGATPTAALTIDSNQNATFTGDVTAASLNSFQLAGRRNMIYNGAMQVAQRGTSFTLAHDGTGNGYPADRFRVNILNWDSYDCVVSQSTEAPDGFNNSLLITTGTAEAAVDADEILWVTYMVEARDCQRLNYGDADAREARLSFWVRSSETGTYAVTLYSEDGDRNITDTYTINAANTWERKTIIVPGDTAGTINNDGGQGLQIGWTIAAGSDWTSTDSTAWGDYATNRWAFGHTENDVATTAGATWHMTGVQFELGTVVTPFEYRSYGDELASCQRYYRKHYALSGNNTQDFIMTAYGSSSWFMHMQYDESNMRAAPTRSLENNSNIQYYRASNSTWTASTVQITSRGIWPHSQTLVYGSQHDTGGGNRLVRKTTAGNLLVVLDAEL